MKRERNPELKRQKIIEATHGILRDGGYFTNFSLDKVAKEAGVSKGGLMHHFASKDALLQAVAQDTIDQFEGRLSAELAADNSPPPGKMTRAYVNTVLSADASTHANSSPLLLSYLNDPTNPPEKNRFETWQAQSETDGLDIITATIVRLVADGLLYTELIDNQPIPTELRAQIKSRLLEMIEKE